MHTQRWLAALSTCAFLLAALGCTGGSGKAIPTSGVVTLDGDPLADVRVTFNPVGGGKIAFSGNVTDAQGRFTLTTEDGKEGAYPGQYKVTILSTGAVKEADPKIAQDLKTMNKERERLTKLRRKDIHANYGNAEKSPLKADIPATGDVKFALTKTGT